MHSPTALPQLNKQLVWLGSVLVAAAVAISTAVAAATEPSLNPSVRGIAYVSNQNSNDLSVIDLEQQKEVARIPVPGNPAGVALGPEGIVFVVSPSDKTVRRIHAKSAQVQAQVQLDGGPIGIAYAPAQNQVFVSDWYNARLWVLNAQTLAVQSTLETSDAPAGVAVHGNVLATADRDANQVSLFDIASTDFLTNNKTKRNVTVGLRPFGLAFAPDGRLFVANVGSDSVSVLAPTGTKVLASIPVGKRPYGIAFAKGFAFVSNQYADTVSVIDLVTLSVVANIEVGEYPEGIDATPDGNTIVVTNWFSNSVSLINAQSLRVIGEVETGNGPRAFGHFITTKASYLAPIAQ